MKHKTLLLVFLSVGLGLWAQTPDSLLRKGQERFAAREFKDGIVYFSQIHRNYPDDPRADDAYYYQGLCYFYLNDYSRSVDHFNRMEKRYPQSRFLSRVNYWQGAAYLGLKNYPKSELAFERQVSFQEEINLLGPSRFYLAFSYEKNGKTLEAIEAYERALQGTGLKEEFQSQSLFRLGVLNIQVEEWQRAGEYLNTLVLDYADTKWAKEALYHLGEIAYYQGQLDRAVSRWETFLQNFPNSAYRQDAIYRLGLVKIQLGDEEGYSLLELLASDYQTGMALRDSLYILAEKSVQDEDWEQARGYYDSLLKDVQDSEERQRLTYGMARTFFSSEKPASALPYLERSQNGPNGNIQRLSLYHQGRIQLESGNWDKGFQHLWQYLNKYKDLKSTETIGQVLVSKVEERGDYPKAFELLDFLENHYKNSADHYIYVLKKVDIAIKEGNSELDTSHLYELTRNTNKDIAAKALYRMGYIYGLRKEYMRSEGYYFEITNLLQRGDLYDKALLARGISFINIEEFSKAVAVLERLLRENPASPYAPKARFYLGKSLKSQGNYFLAAQELEKAVVTQDSILKERILWELGDSLSLASLEDEAYRVWSEYLKQFPDSEKSSLAIEKGVDAALSAGLVTEAEIMLAPLNPLDHIRSFVNTALAQNNPQKAIGYLEQSFQDRALNEDISQGIKELFQYLLSQEDRDLFQDILEKWVGSEYPEEVQKAFLLQGARMALTEGQFEISGNLFLRYLESFPKEKSSLGAADSLGRIIQLHPSSDSVAQLWEDLKNRQTIPYPTDPIFLALARIFPEDNSLTEKLQEIMMNPESRKYLIEAQYLLGERYFAQELYDEAYLLFQGAIQTEDPVLALEGKIKMVQSQYHLKGFLTAAEELKSFYLQEDDPRRQGRLLYEGLRMASLEGMMDHPEALYFRQELSERIPDSIWNEKAKSLE